MRQHDIRVRHRRHICVRPRGKIDTHRHRNHRHTVPTRPIRLRDTYTPPPARTSSHHRRTRSCTQTQHTLDRTFLARATRHRDTYTPPPARTSSHHRHIPDTRPQNIPPRKVPPHRYHTPSASTHRYTYSRSQPPPSTPQPRHLNTPNKTPVLTTPYS